jgi:hypothetical protein
VPEYRPALALLVVLRMGRVSVATRGCLLGATGGCWAHRGLLMPTVILVSIWLPVSSVLSACYCLGRHCVIKSLVIPGYDRTISSASTTCAYTYLSVACNRWPPAKWHYLNTGSDYSLGGVWFTIYRYGDCSVNNIM